MQAQSSSEVKPQKMPDASTDGITLHSDSSDSESSDSVEQMYSLIHYADDELPPNQPDAKNGSTQSSQIKQEPQELNFESTPSNVSGNDSQSNSKSKRGNLVHEASYNDTLSYLESVLGQTYLENLSKDSLIKQAEHLPPKIQSSSTCLKIPSVLMKSHKQSNQTKLNKKQTIAKPEKDEKIPDPRINPFSKKQQTRIVSSATQNQLRENKEDRKRKKSKDSFRQDKKKDVSAIKSVSKVKRKDQIREKSQTRTEKTPAKTLQPKKQKKNRHEPQYYADFPSEQRPYYQQPYSTYHSDKDSYQEYPEFQQNYHPFYGYPGYQKIPYYKNYSNQEKSHQAYHNGPGQYYVPGDKRKKSRAQEERIEREKHSINGWYFPNRGNVVYDAKDQPCVIGDRMGIDDRYFEQLRKRQFLTTMEREFMARYMCKKSQLYQFNPYPPHYPYYPDPYEYHSSRNQMVPNDFYPNANSANSLSQPTNNSQISTKTTPLNQKIRNHQILTNQSPSSVNQVPVRVHPKKTEVKTSFNVSTKTYPNPPQEQQKKKPIDSQQFHQPKKKASQKYYSQTTKQQIPPKVLPPDILKQQTFYEQSRPQIQTGLMIPKEQNQPHLKSQVFLLYQIPVIVTNEDVKKVYADIFLVPYSHQMIKENQPSKWIDYLQKVTGIEIIKKLCQMNTKELNERGRDISEGTLSKVSLSQRKKFSSIYFVKLTNFVDQDSKKPYGQTILKNSISRVLNSFIGDVQEMLSKEKTLLINGGYFPGVQREKTPKSIASSVYLALANLSREYRDPPSGLKIIINVLRPDQYPQYIKHFRLILNEYRKIQAF